MSPKEPLESLVFSQIEVFSRKWAEMRLNDDDLQELEEFLLDNSNADDTIAETGCAKKVRIPMEVRGKRGGGRIVYVDAVVKEYYDFHECGAGLRERYGDGNAEY